MVTTAKPILGYFELPDISGAITDGIKSAAQSMVGDLLGTIVDQLIRLFLWFLEKIMLLFMETNFDATEANQDQYESTQHTIDMLNSALTDITLFALGAGFLLALMQIVTQRMMAMGDAAAPEAFLGFLRYFIVAAGLTTIIIACWESSDRFTQWMFHDSLGDKTPGEIVGKLRDALSGNQGNVKYESIVAIVVCLMAVVAYMELMTQVVLVQVWVIYLAVGMPIAASLSLSSGGKEIFNSLVKMAIGILLFKPIAAIMFAGALAWIDRNPLDNDMLIMAAVIMMCAPAFCLPAISKLIGTPVTMTGGGLTRGAATLAAGVGLKGISKGLSKGFGNLKDHTQSQHSTAGHDAGTSSGKAVQPGGGSNYHRHAAGRNAPHIINGGSPTTTASPVRGGATVTGTDTSPNGRKSSSGQPSSGQRPPEAVRANPNTHSAQETNTGTSNPAPTVNTHANNKSPETETRDTSQPNATSLVAVQQHTVGTRRPRDTKFQRIED